MFHHMVMFRFRAGTSEDQIDAITDGLASLPGKIDVLSGYRFGPDAGITDGSWDYGVAADFVDEAHYPDYSSHPAHVTVFKDRIAPVVDEIARVQFRS
jgi:hypothetical protein